MCLLPDTYNMPKSSTSGYSKSISGQSRWSKWRRRRKATEVSQRRRDIFLVTKEPSTFNIMHGSISVELRICPVDDPRVSYAYVSGEHGAGTTLNSASTYADENESGNQSFCFPETDYLQHDYSEFNRELFELEAEADVIDTSDEEAEKSNVKQQATEKDVPSIIKDIALATNATHSSVNYMLASFKPLFPSLPKDARTIMKTEKEYGINGTGGGTYHHFGLKNQFLEEIRTSKIHLPSDLINLQLNIDGLPLTKSSGSQFWPILARIVDNGSQKGTPFIVGIYHGYSKPKTLDFLEQIVSEIIALRSQGIFIAERRHYIVVSAIIILPTELKYPARTGGEMEDLEEHLSDAKIMDALARKLSIHGTDNVGESTRRLMTCLSDEYVLATYNWCGGGNKGKKAYSRLRIKKVICRAIELSPITKYDEAAIEKSMKDCLRCISDRNGGREERRRRAVTTAAEIRPAELGVNQD